jgi:hypothetical protein
MYIYTYMYQYAAQATALMLLSVTPAPCHAILGLVPLLTASTPHDVYVVYVGPYALATIIPRHMAHLITKALRSRMLLAISIYHGTMISTMIDNTVDRSTRNTRQSSHRHTILAHTTYKNTNTGAQGTFGFGTFGKTPGQTHKSAIAASLSSKQRTESCVSNLSLKLYTHAQST